MVVDVAMRSITSAVLLAQRLVPQPVRPGWPACLSVAVCVMPRQRSVSIDARVPCEPAASLGQVSVGAIGVATMVSGFQFQEVEGCFGVFDRGSSGGRPGSDQYSFPDLHS